MVSRIKLGWRAKSSPKSANSDLHTSHHGHPLTFSYSLPTTRSDTATPTFSTHRRLSDASLTDPQSSPDTLQLDPPQLVLDELEPQQSSSLKPPPELSARSTGSFGKMALNSMIGGLSVLSLSRTLTNTSSAGDEKESRGRTLSLTKRVRSSSAVPDTDVSHTHHRARSYSPFTFRRFRQRDPSPIPQPLRLATGDIELSGPSSDVQPQTAFADDPESGDETFETDLESDDDLDDLAFDPLTTGNTRMNAQIATADGDSGLGDIELDPDPLGEGVNVVVPSDLFLPPLDTYSSSHKGKRAPRRRKSTRHIEPLPLNTSRPIFQRDRCTIVITQGDPEGSLGGRKHKTYIVASDLSEESRYAVEWGIGTVIRDGDELIIITVVENESKVDPPIPNAADRALKVRCQQERQGLAYILGRQATSLLQRTRLHVRVVCQAWHAKNPRYMILDIVDYHEPTMLIVGSRGLGQLKGILLGSTSHYLIQKCSVPVMVARRRLKRPPRHSAHLLKNRAHVSLAQAGIDRVASKVDVVPMRDEVDEDRSRKSRGSQPDQVLEEGEEGEEGDLGEPDDNSLGVKVPG